MTGAGSRDRLDVLLVDDDEDGLCDLTAALSRAGLVCVGVTSGWNALELLFKGTVPLIIVTDIRMPELGGLELAQRLRRMDMSTPPEIVLISGSAELDHAVEAIRVRARDLLTKPLDLRRLIQIVREVQLERRALFLSTAAPRANGNTNVQAQTKTIDIATISTNVLNNLRRLRRVRAENLPAGVAIEASWEILLDLYVSEMRGERTSLTAVGGSAGVPMSSALRRIHELEAKGMILRTADEKDRRRAAIHLTDRGRGAVETFIHSYLTGCSEVEQSMLPSEWNFGRLT